MTIGFSTIKEKYKNISIGEMNYFKNLLFEMFKKYASDNGLKFPDHLHILKNLNNEFIVTKNELDSFYKSLKIIKKNFKIVQFPLEKANAYLSGFLFECLMALEK